MQSTVYCLSMQTVQLLAFVTMTTASEIVSRLSDKAMVDFILFSSLAVPMFVILCLVSSWPVSSVVACLTSEVAQLCRVEQQICRIETISILRQFVALALSSDWSIVCLYVSCCFRSKLSTYYLLYISLIIINISYFCKLIDVMEWTDAKTSCLINVYERKPCLYDFKAENYHNRVVKAKAWQEVADACETTGRPIY